MAAVSRVVISSEVGWRKPALEFFAALCRVSALDPGEVWLVGDDVGNDYEGATAAGCRALLLGAAGEESAGRCVVADLDHLLEGGCFPDLGQGEKGSLDRGKGQF